MHISLTIKFLFYWKTKIWHLVHEKDPADMSVMINMKVIMVFHFSKFSETGLIMLWIQSFPGSSGN